MNRQAHPVSAETRGWFERAILTVSNWLTVGPSPKVRDPQNAERRGGSSAGVCVNDQQALTLSAFFACLRLVASTIGSLPLPLYRRNGDGVAIEARDHPLWRVLHDSPNADQTSLDYWEFVVVSLLMRGNHFARKIKDGTRLIGLEPIRPDIVQVVRGEGGEIRYRWAWGGERFDLSDEDVFHVRGFGGGPMGGLSVLAYARESLGIAIAADRAAGSMFGNGVLTSGAISFDKFLTDEQRAIARGELADQFQGAHNAGRPFILEGGADWKQISMKADEAQLLESRAWSVEDVCRWFGVPPILIGHSEKQTSWGTGVEQVLLGFLKFTLAPYLRRVELAIRQQLIAPADQRTLFAEFNIEGLLRGDSAGRARFYEVMTRIGVMSRNECRAKENLPPVEGGNVITVQMQNIALEEAVRRAIEDGGPAAASSGGGE